MRAMPAEKDTLKRELQRGWHLYRGGKSFSPELKKRGLRVERQKKVMICYDGMQIDDALRMDLLVEDCVIVEIKAVETMNPVFTAQTLTYLKLTERRLAFLINFNVARIKDGIKRLIR
jgi:GxxExxY protein